MAAATVTLGDLATLHDTIQDKNSNEMVGGGTADNIINGKGIDKVFTGKFNTIKIVMLAIFVI